MRLDSARPSTWRRGVTLVEMLVVVALLVLVMTILVAIFASATGAITAQRTYAALDQDLRRVESMLRRDLDGVTAKMDPTTPASPADNRGYFCYAENAVADLQGEDTDDTIAFTTQAPADQPFIGTVVVPATDGVASHFHRVTVSSQYAEVIYFLRNGNLYRRVFLILPGGQWEQALQRGLGRDASGLMLAGAGYNTTPGTGPAYNFTAASGETNGLYGLPASWQYMNDVSARPSLYKNPGAVALNSDKTDKYMPQLNTLGDLTNRENRAFNPRHATDYSNDLGVVPPDGKDDDLDLNGVPDYYTTVYPAAFGTVIALSIPPTAINPSDMMAFPYIYPNAYSKADPFTSSDYGPIHSLDPSIDTTKMGVAPPYNHNPLDVGDPLGGPTSTQTWWGFPTKKEMLSPYWTDPIKRLNDTGKLAWEVFYAPGSVTSGPDLHLQESGAAYKQSLGLRQASAVPEAALPPMTPAWRGWNHDQSFTGGAGGSSAFITIANGKTPLSAATWQALPEEDLVLTGVRSFDVKALEVRYYNPYPAKAGKVPAIPPRSSYVDLGWANLYAGTPPRADSGIDMDGDGESDYFYNTLTTFAHEGRIPPRVEDYRTDASWPQLRANIGDNTAGVICLRRVWDSWSMDYARTPDSINPFERPPFVAPVLPSYPAPYPSALTGLQIQVRVVGPANQRIKSLTIRHDFSDQLK